jgi:hypothetical protein
VFLLGLALWGQTNTGELRLTITDPAGLPVAGSVDLVSEVNQYHQTLEADAQGQLTAKLLPYGLYRVEVSREGFAPSATLVEIRSALPKQLKVVLGVAPLETTVTVSDEETLIDSHRTAPSNRIGADTLRDRETALPGRSLLELVNTQPGWLLEANGVLHPRGSEYQTQYVMDGIPFTDNRSPAFVADPDADDVQSMNVMTADYPAEYGRKLGGVIEVVTARDKRPGFHGKAVGYGGSFDTAGGYLMGQYGRGRNTFSLNGDTATTGRFLDPPVERNFTNQGTTSGMAAHYERDLSDQDRFGAIFRRAESRFLVPNEFVQQAAGQRQDRDSHESSGQLSYQHIFSPNLLGDLRGMVRDLSADLWSNRLATPIIAGQDRSFREGYVKGSLSVDRGVHELKTGLEADFASLRERFQYQITDPNSFDPQTPPAFAFFDRAEDREQAVFVQDLVRLRNWTFNAGLRWDHYRLLVDENAWSPRLGASWYWRAADLLLRASYDRVFQTPAFENILLASSATVAALSSQVLRLPVRPSYGNFYQGGLAKGVLRKLRLEASYYRRDFADFADDDLLLNTGVSFPIAWRKAEIHGAEVQIEIPRWGPFAGFLSYSNMRGTGYPPVTGGLFLGSEAAQASAFTKGSFPITQDQRNTVSSRFRYQVAPRLWVALAGAYGSGLPTEFNGTGQEAVSQYGQRIVDRVNFERGRVRPSFTLDGSAGVTVRKADRGGLRVVADLRNLTNRLNVIDFAGIFSGTALEAPRSYSLRLQADF